MSCHDFSPPQRTHPLASISGFGKKQIFLNDYLADPENHHFMKAKKYKTDFIY
jgi:hypothetical protein